MPTPQTMQDVLDRAAAAPLDPATHARLGDLWLDRKQPVRAAACYRTAAALGEVPPEMVMMLALAELEAGRPALAADRLRTLKEQAPGFMDAQVSELENRCRTAAAPPVEDTDHNRHFRMSTLAAFLRRITGSETFELLDVGGGDGLLGMYLPGTSYLLAEPATNGIRGEDLPFAERCADVVCACHVLEHVPAPDRFGFLDSLRARARGHLVLLNPFAVPGSRAETGMRLVLDVTGAEWAREHLECGLPEVAVVEEYARARGLEYAIAPNGDLPVAFLCSLVNHYARRAGRAEDLPRINRYLNAVEPDLMTNPRQPTAMLVHFSW